MTLWWDFGQLGTVLTNSIFETYSQKVGCEMLFKCNLNAHRACILGGNLSPNAKLYVNTLAKLV